jgi:hypothetical protein
MTSEILHVYDFTKGEIFLFSKPTKIQIISICNMNYKFVLL